MCTTLRFALCAGALRKALPAFKAKADVMLTVAPLPHRRSLILQVCCRALAKLVDQMLVLTVHFTWHS